MTDILVTSPFHPFTLPTQFKAVFNGYIYCGTVDAVDPSVSQVQVYLANEDGSRTPVAQPLRTNAGGFLVYNGQPAKFITASNHSLLVMDSLEAKLWYAPDVSVVDPSTAFQIIGNQATEALRRTYAASNMQLVPGSFSSGGVLPSPSSVMVDQLSGKAYAWGGPFPQGGHVVPEGTDPTIAGSGYQERYTVSQNVYADIRAFGYVQGMDNALPAIQAAIDSLPANGGTVILPPHHINIAPINGRMIEIGDGDGGTGFSTKNGIKIIGAGAGFGVSGALVPTILNYNGGSAVVTPMIASKGRVSDCAVRGALLSLNGKCGGISINSTSGSDYDSLKIINPAPGAIALSVIGGIAPTGNYNTFNRFSKISIALLSPNSIGLYMDGDFAAQNDTWITHFELMRIENFAGATGSTLAWFKFVDSCTFRRCHFDNKPEPSSNGVIFDSTNNNGFPAGMAFYDCSVHQTAVLEDASHKIRKNYFYGNGTYDNEITPTHPLLCGITDTGNVFGEFLYGYPWKSVAATVTAGLGALTTVSGAVQYQKLGATVNIRGTVFITTNGTGAGFIRVQLPAEVPVANENCFFIGRNTATGGALVGQIAAGSSTIFIRKFDDTYPGANGAQLEFSGVYMVTKV